MRRRLLGWLLCGALGCSVGFTSSSGRAADRPKVTFVGFQQLQAGGGRIFVHLTAAPSRVNSVKGDKLLTFSLADTDIGARNNRYPLELENFELPVTRAVLKVHDADVDVELQLRHPIELSQHIQSRSDGTVVLEIDLPSE